MTEYGESSMMRRTAARFRLAPCLGVSPTERGGYQAFAQHGSRQQRQTSYLHRLVEVSLKRYHREQEVIRRFEQRRISGLPSPERFSLLTKS